jgi:hypothetical protein
MHNRVLWTVTRAKDGSTRELTSENLRTNDGVNWQANHMGNSAITAINYIAITENTASPASGNTNLLAEESADGLARALATFSHTADQSLYTLTRAFQYTGGSTKTIAKAAVAAAATDLDTSADTHFLITLVSPLAVLDSNDTLQIQWGVDV